MTPIDLYKEFIDSFVALADAPMPNWSSEESDKFDYIGNRLEKVLISRLKIDERLVLAKRLKDARIGGVHDALVVLNDRMAKNNGVYSENGVEMEIMPYGTELYSDYISRCDGEDWDDE